MRTDPGGSDGAGRVFFVHIQKTGGTTLRGLLEQYHHAERIAPADLLGVTARQQRVAREKITRTAEIDAYSFFHEHTNYADFLGDGLERVTMLREPVARIRSQLIDWQRFNRRAFWRVWRQRVSVRARRRPTPDEQMNAIKYRSRRMDLAELLRVEGDQVSRNFHNAMAKTLVSNFPVPEHVRLGGDELVEVAKGNLDRMGVVGILERLDDSVLLLCDRFGWPVPDSMRRLNVNPERMRGTVSDDPVIEEATRLDRVVYEHGRRVFEEAYSELVERHHEGMRGGKTLRECVDDSARERWLCGVGARSKEVEGGMDAPVRGIGWHERQGTGGGVYRWTGRRSTIECLVEPAEAYRVGLRIVGGKRGDLRAMRVRVNGAQSDGVDIGRGRVGPGSVLWVSAVVRGRPVGDDGFCRVEILVGESGRGVAVSGYRVEPCG